MHCKATLYFIEVVGDVNDYLADIKLCVKESITYVHISQNNQSMMLPSVPKMGNSGILANYVLQNGISSAVVPLAGIQVVTNATTEKRLRFFEFEKYILGNISFAAQIRNQNTYNIEDEEYDVNRDYGYFSQETTIIIPLRDGKINLGKILSMRLQNGRSMPE